MIDRGVRADDEDHFRLGDVAHRIRDRPGVDPLHQRGDARGVAQARAVIDVVRAESGAHQLLEQVGLFVGALRRTEAGQRPLAVGVSNRRASRSAAKSSASSQVASRNTSLQLSGSTVKSLCLATPGLRISGRGQAMLVLHVVEAVAALDAEPARVRRAVLALHEQNLVRLDVVGELAADAAVRADRLHLLVGDDLPDFAGRHERPGRTGLHALAAGDARGFAHRIVEVEHDLRVRAAEGVADDVVDLFFAAGAHAAAALDAGVEVHRDGRVRDVLDGLMPGAKRGLPTESRLRPAIELGVERVGRLRHVREQQLEHHLLAGHRAWAVGRDLHAFGGIAAA